MPSSKLSTSAQLLESKVGEEQYKQLLQDARRSIVLSIHSATIQAAAAVNPNLINLQMLEVLHEAWDLKESGSPMPFFWHRQLTLQLICSVLDNIRHSKHRNLLPILLRLKTSPGLSMSELCV